MFRLGIIGSDNSHAEAFSKLTNLDEGYNGLKIDDAQVTHIYGTDPVRTKEVAEKGKIPNIVTRLEDMLAGVDGVLCVWRHGSKHLQDTLPFLKAGIPAFVDKPLASSVPDARQLIETAQKSGIGFTSFSTLYFAQSTVAYIDELKKTAGTLTAGVSSGPAKLDDEYDGIFFYGIHAVQMMNAVWGYGCESVQAVSHNRNCVAACKFSSGALVTLNLMGNAKYAFHTVAFGTDGWKELTGEASTSYYDGMKIILEVMRTGKWVLTPEQMLEPIQILAALQKSLAEGREVKLSEV